MTITHEPVVITPDRGWRDRAACRGGDPERFFPSAAAGPEYEAQVGVARAVCTGCSVRTECLGWALDALPYGVAGGMSEQERRDERTRRQGRRRPCRVPERPVGGTAGEVAAAGRAAIGAGTSPRAVAREFGRLSNPRTASTSTASTSTASTSTASTSTAGTSADVQGSVGGRRAPLLISRRHFAGAGTRAAEGTRA